MVNVRGMRRVTYVLRNLQGFIFVLKYAQKAVFCMKKIDVDILWEIDEEKELESAIYRVVETALSVENALCNVNLSMVVTDDERIRVVNREQRQIDRATDVLSFPGYEKNEWNELKNVPEELAFIGDIVISKEHAVAQAEEYGHSFEREFCYLLAHGMLHLMGYDHIDEDDRKVMREKEEEIMKKMSLERENA